nr:MAG TPA: hypothetical protein [Caudoviricetes sp.]
MIASRRPSVVLDLSKAVSFEPSESRRFSNFPLTSRTRPACGTFASVSLPRSSSAIL